MELVLSWDPEIYVGFFLVFLRTSGFFYIFPLFSRPYCPNAVRIMLALVTALLLAPTAELDPGVLAVAMDWTGLVIPAIREMTVGVTLGLAALLILVAGQLAGQYLDLQMGFFTASQIDPVMGGRMPLVGQYLYLCALVVFLGFDGHHHVLTVLKESLTRVPGGAPFSVAGLPDLFGMMSWLFYASLRISIPVMAALFLASVALGIIGRAMPQLNVFVLGIPLRILVGFTLLVGLVPIYVAFFRDASSERLTVLFRMLAVW